MSDPAHGAVENLHDDPDSHGTFIIMLVGFNLLIAIVVWLDVIFHNELQAERDAKQRPPATLMAYEAAQDTLLATYDWVDREVGVVSVPVTRAMDLVVAEAGATPTTP